MAIVGTSAPSFETCSGRVGRCGGGLADLRVKALREDRAQQQAATRCVTLIGVPIRLWCFSVEAFFNRSDRGRREQAASGPQDT